MNPGVNPGAALDIVADGPRSVVKLDGDWKLLPIEGLDLSHPPKDADAPGAGWRNVTVPSREYDALPTINGLYTPNLNAYLNDQRNGLKRSRDMAGWFRRAFVLPAELPADSRAILHLHGVAFKSQTWLNDKPLGTWLLAQIPVEYDVTDLLQAGGVNTLVVGVTDREGIIDPSFKTFIAPASGASTGIWGSVELRFVPNARIQDIFVKTKVNEKKLALELTLVNQSTSPRTLTPRALIADAQGSPQTDIQG